MAHALTDNDSSFLGIGFELILYGIYIVLFLTAFRGLTWARRTEKIHKFYLFFCCFMFSCCTIHVFIKFRYFYKDLIQLRNPDNLLEAGTPALRTADALVTLIDFFGEIILIYRLWVIWEQKYYVIILPTIISLAFVSCAMATIGILVSSPNAAIVPKSLVPLGTAAFFLPLCFNIIVSGLIIGRLWYRGRQTTFALRTPALAKPSVDNLRRAIIVCIESAGLYVIVQFVLAVLFALNHPGQILLSDIATQVYGIAPTLIFVRIGLGQSSGSNVFVQLNSTPSPSFPRRTRSTGQFPQSPPPSRPGREEQSIVIPVTTTYHSDANGGFELKDWPSRGHPHEQSGP